MLELQHGWSAVVVVGAQDGRGCARAKVNDRRVGIAMQEVEMGMVGPLSVRRERPFVATAIPRIWVYIYL
jgi:hypothetical protein